MPQPHALPMHTHDGEQTTVHRAESSAEDWTRSRRRSQAGHAGANLVMIRRVAVSLLKRAGTKGSVHTRRLRAGWDDQYMAQVIQGLSTHSA